MVAIALCFLHEHELFGKPPRTFPDHALAIAPQSGAKVLLGHIEAASQLPGEREGRKGTNDISR
jgi:hypothetical protein